MDGQECPSYLTAAGRMRVPESIGSSPTQFRFRIVEFARVPFDTTDAVPQDVDALHLNLDLNETPTPVDEDD